MAGPDLAFRLGGTHFQGSDAARTSLISERGFRHSRRRRLPSRRLLGIRAQQTRDERGPAGLVRGAETAAGIAVEEFVEQHIVAEMRVLLLDRRVAEDRPFSIRSAQKNAA